MKIEFETEDCAHCPCLRNNEYGEFYCFFQSDHLLSVYTLDVADDTCPIKKEERSGVIR